MNGPLRVRAESRASWPRRWTGALAAVGIALAGSAPASAQDLREVRLDRADILVRVHAAAVSPAPMEGRVQRLREDSVLVVRLEGGQEIEVPRSHIDRLEFSTGRHGHPWWGAVIGTVAMGIPSAIYWSRECEGGTSCDQAGVKGFFLGGVIYGALPGLLVGSLIRTRDWRVLPLVYLESAVIRREGAGRPDPSFSATVPGLSVGVRIPVGGRR